MKRIPLAKSGLFSFVDDEDYDRISQRKWRIKKSGKRVYAFRTKWHPLLKKYKSVFLHREIMMPPQGMVVDHVNGDGLDNRRTNLRICTPSQNQWNSNPRKSESIYKGVTRSRKKWQAKIKVFNKEIYLGVFDSQSEAARAYNVAAKEYHGEYARVNEI